MFSRLFSVFKKAVLAIVVLGGFVAFYNYLQATKPEVVASPPQEQVWIVQTVPAYLTDALPAEEAFGTVRAAREAELRFGVSGEVSFLSDKLRDGVRIEKGELLAQLDSERLNLALEDVRLQIQAEKLQIASLEKQLELRQRAVERTRSMVSRSVATEANLDDAELALTISDNQLAQSKARLAQLNVVEKNRLKDIEDSELKAPFTGRLSNVNLGLGNRVGNANLVAKLTDLSALEVPFVVPAQIYSNLTELMGRTIQLSWQSTGQTVATANAIITRSEALVDKTEGGGRLFAELINSVNQPIPPGAFVRIAFSGRRFVDVYEIPEEALVGADMVFVVEEGRASQRAVEIVHRSPGKIWIRGEIEQNDQIIATRIPGIGDGLRVRITTEN